MGIPQTGPAGSVLLVCASEGLWASAVQSCFVGEHCDDRERCCDVNAGCICIEQGSAYLGHCAIAGLTVTVGVGPVEDWEIKSQVVLVDGVLVNGVLLNCVLVNGVGGVNVLFVE